MTLHKFKYFLVIAVALLMYGCATQNGVVKYGSISNKEITITAEDGSFTLKAGERFEPPFQSDTATANELHGAAANITMLYSDALKKLGAKKVKVQVNGEVNKEYYGVLLFSKIYSDGYGPGTRSYLINIPDLYLQAANGGKVSVITELYNRKKGGNAKSWVLWLSDLPFEA